MRNREKIKEFCINTASNLCEDMSITITNMNELNALVSGTNLIEKLVHIAKMVDEIKE